MSEFSIDFTHNQDGWGPTSTYIKEEGLAKKFVGFPFGIAHRVCGLLMAVVW